MSRGIPLTRAEKSTISLQKRQGWTVAEICGKLKRSSTVVRNFLKDPQGYGTKKGGGRRSKLTPNDKRLIIRKAKTGLYSASEIKKLTKVNVTTRTIQYLLQACPELAYMKKRKGPKITKVHAEMRKKFAEKQLLDSNTWNKVIFSDEKKFNLDGPDGFRYYWHDLRKEEKIHSKRQFGGGSIMVWAGISLKGRTELFMTEGTINSQVYTKILTEKLLPFTKEHYKRGFIFQQDNASIHTSKVTKAFLEKEKIKTLDWPSHSPDLNPIENLWGIIVRDLYKNGNKQFDTREQLKKALLKTWKNLDDKKVRKLVKSMPKRLVKVVNADGKQIDH